MAKTKLVGIVNVTPDSFSDGGKYMNAKAALAAAEQMMADGADIIDIGAESTRPGATPITHEEEWARLKDLLPQLVNIRWGLDTRHPQTAAKALEYGAHWINDVSGFSDPEMLDAVRDSDCRLVVMHSLTVPADKGNVMPDGDTLTEISVWADTRMGYMAENDVGKERLIFDPGIGFGKTAAQSWEIVRNIEKFKVLGVPLFVGHSRKSFLSFLPSPLRGEGWEAVDRDKLTLQLSRELIAKGVDYLRVHDVVAHRELL